MTKRIFKSIFLAAFCVLLASLVSITGCLYEYYSKTFENQMRDELDLAAAAVDISGSEYLKAIAPSGYRLSLIDKNGKVLYDTVQDADTLTNHADRDEVKQALENGDGSSTRYSSTLLKKTTYIAKKLGNGNILRISSSRATVGMLVFEAMQPILIVIVAALIISAIIAFAAMVVLGIFFDMVVVIDVVSLGALVYCFDRRRRVRKKAERLSELHEKNI